MNLRSFVVALALSVSVAGAPALADPPVHGAALPPAPRSAWSAVLRRTCRSYAPGRDMAFDPGGRTVTWCMGRFSLADGRYLGEAPYDADPPRVHLADGRELVTREVSPGRWQVAASHAHGRRMEPLGTGLTDLHAVTVSVRGESAIVTRADGRRAVVALPSGRTILPLAADGHESRSAVSPNGTVLALASPVSVVLYDISGPTPQRMAVLPERRAAIAFTDDGRDLVSVRGDGTLLVAWREGAAEVPPPAVPVHFAVGNHVVPVAAPDGWLPRLDPSRHAPAAPRGEHGLVTAWRRMYGAHAGSSDARVFVTDAAEFAGQSGRTDAWGRAVMARYADGGWDPTTLRVWSAATGRAASWQTRREGHPGTWQTAVRAQEVRGSLVRVEIDQVAGCAAMDPTVCAGLRGETAGLTADLVTGPLGPEPLRPRHHR